MLAVILTPFILAMLAPYLHRLAPRASAWLLSLPAATMAVYLAAQAPGVLEGGHRVLDLPWAPALGVRFSFYLDGLSLSFALLISGIGALIILYSGPYLKGDPQQGRFYCILLLFKGAMLGLVLADNVITFFFFWELTSVTSYLLIGFENGRKEARDAALQALLVTGGGGLALLAGLILLGNSAGTWSLSEMAASGDAVQQSALYTPILILILLGAFTKSAQFPFHFWLPNAMQAPTPVSAYLHSSTMVKAGLYLMARLHPALGGTDLWKWLLIGAGGLTIAVSAYFALRKTVLKPVLAYTTLIALGLITVCLGIGTREAVKAGIVFLFVHALYKAALFMIAGAVDHEAGEKDTVRLSGLRRHMPIAATAAGLAALSMAGLPPLFGFIGKEELYKAGYHAHSGMLLILTVMFLGNMMNVFAAWVTGVGPFWGKEQETPKHPHDGPVGLWLGALLLGLAGLALGIFPKPLGHYLIAPAATAAMGEAVSVDLKLWHGVNVPFLLSVATITLGLLLYGLRAPLRRAVHGLRALHPYGAEGAYGAGLKGLNAFAVWQTRLLQHGYLRYYVMVVIAFMSILTLWALLGQAQVTLPESIAMPQLYEIGLVLITAAAAIYCTIAKNRLVAVISLGVVGYGVALLFILFGAPDLGMTQFLIETFTVLLFVLVFYNLPAYLNVSSQATRFRDACVSVLGGGLVAAMIFVAVQLDPEKELKEFFLENSYDAAHGKNVVNVILVDFRALDTLGEITVLAASAMGIYSLLRLRHKEKVE